MPETSRYALPFLSAAQAQKEVTHNEALARLDILLHLAVESRRATPPTAAPVPGTAWIVPSAATGDWQGHDGAVAAFDDAGWTYVVPRDGCIAYVRDERGLVCFADGSWLDGWPVPALTVAGRPVLAGDPAEVEPPSGGAVIDEEARRSLSALIVTLQSAGLLAPT